MARCHPLPRQWLFTDRRLADDGLNAARALPPGSGIVVRSEALTPPARLRLIRQLRAVARARGLTLILAGSAPAHARKLGAAGVHLRGRSARQAYQARRLGLLTSAPVHSRAEALAVRHARIAIAFISPLHDTRSHPGAVPLGARRWTALARSAGAAPVALGGMNEHRSRVLRRRVMGSKLYAGWAAIDAWGKRAAARRQKRNCVPT
jgi:thiamine-phosphate pyrophosphorylase